MKSDSLFLLSQILRTTATPDNYLLGKTKLEDYFWHLDYSEIDYAVAYSFFKKYGDFSSGACSSIAKGSLLCRNLDWKYGYGADCVIHTPHTANRKQVVGTAGALEGFTNDLLENASVSNLYRIAPFYLQDGMNEDGLAASINVVPADYGSTIALPTGEQESEINAVMLVRYILDHFSDATTAVNYVKEHCKVFFLKGLHRAHYEAHILVADKNHKYVVEFVNGDTEIIDASYMTNFHLFNVTHNQDGTVMTPASGDPVSVNGITVHGSGLERYNIIAEDYPSLSSASAMRATLDKLIYSRSYPTSNDPANPIWYTEFVGGDLHCNSSLTAFAPTLDLAGSAYTQRDRSNPVTWQTTHSVIYDLDHLTMKIRSQEHSTDYTFSIDGNRIE